MPPPFHPLTVDQFGHVLRKTTVRRRITAVHLHHTWRPRHSDYSGHDTIVGMWRFHTRDQGWRDIAQHLSIAPDGTLWTGRPWDWPPASAEGHNGNNTAGPFMIEMIGNFDRNEDPFRDPQRGAALDTLAHLLIHFQLPVEAIKFHREMSTKTCPGSAIDRDSLFVEVTTRMEELRAPGVSRATTLQPFSEEMDAVYDVLASFAAARRAPRNEDELSEGEAQEPLEDAAPLWALALDGAGSSRDIDTIELTPAVLDTLKPHVINLTNGRFSSSGTFTTSRLDVDTIFDTHLPKALATAKAEGRPLHIVLYAHGGLVSEEEGLRGALKHIDWWIRNGVYPLYFVWETGIIETLRTFLAGAAAARAGLSEFTDAQIEGLARKHHASALWTGMKENARRSVAPDGGGTHTVGKLAAFCNAHGPKVQVHAVGHSAGAIFHSFLLPAAIGAGVPTIATLQYLAPAIRVDSFMERISGLLGRGIGPLTMYTMRDTFEEADNVGGFYRKSLLLLIHHALEDERETPIVGLHNAVRDDLRLKRLFGLNPAVVNPVGEIVFSTTATTTGRSASQSTSHGGFDDDPSTMNSVVRRVLSVDDTATIVEFVRPKSVIAAPAPSSFPAVVMSAPAAPASLPSAVGTAGARRALCVGINRYRRQPLSGCVADAHAWAQTLRGLGFEEVRMLLDEEATRDTVLRELHQLVSKSTAGDLLVFQFSGHGTTLPDRNADESGGDTPKDDEAICPIDFSEGRFIVDDDIAAVYASIREGVGVTNFTDCCHSGSITRFGAGAASRARATGDDRPRFIQADADMIQRHFQFRANLGGGGAARGPASMTEVLFAACRSNELAFESGGQGDFTRAATSLLRRGIAGITNTDFETCVIAELGATPRQHPELDCAPAARTSLLLTTSAIAAPAAVAVIPADISAINGREAALADVLTSIAALLRK